MRWTETGAHGRWRWASLQLLFEVQYETHCLLNIHSPEAARAPQARVDDRADHGLIHTVKPPQISFNDEEHAVTGGKQAAGLLSPAPVRFFIN